MKYVHGRNTIKLIVAIIIIAIVVILGVRYAIKFIKSEKVKELQYDMLLVKNKTEIFYAKHTLNKDENPLLGYQLNNLPENINVDEFKGKNVIPESDYEKYYLLDSTCFDKMDLGELNNKYKGYFIVNYEGYEVIYTEGYENKNGMWCYKISDLEKKPEEKKITESPAQNVEENNAEEQSSVVEQTEENTEN